MSDSEVVRRLKGASGVALGELAARDDRRRRASEAARAAFDSEAAKELVDGILEISSAVGHVWSCRNSSGNGSGHSIDIKLRTPERTDPTLLQIFLFSRPADGGIEVGVRVIGSDGGQLTEVFKHSGGINPGPAFGQSAILEVWKCIGKAMQDFILFAIGKEKGS